MWGMWGYYLTQALKVDTGAVVATIDNSLSVTQMRELTVGNMILH